RHCAGIAIPFGHRVAIVKAPFGCAWNGLISSCWFFIRCACGEDRNEKHKRLNDFPLSHDHSKTFNVLLQVSMLNRRRDRWRLSGCRTLLFLWIGAGRHYRVALCFVSGRAEKKQSETRRSRRAANRSISIASRDRAKSARYFAPGFPGSTMPERFCK